MLPRLTLAAFELPPAIDDAESATRENIATIEWLMTRYCHRPSACLANDIVARLEWLRERAAEVDAEDPDWTCQRLLGHWHYIARNRPANKRS